MFCTCWQRCLWGHSAARTYKKHIKAGCGNSKPPRRMYTLHMRGNRCILGRWVSLLLALHTSLTFPLFTLYLFLLISLSKLPVHFSRWLPFWLYSLSRRCSESRFKWKHPCVWHNTWHCLGYFKFESDISKIAQIIFLLEIAPEIAFHSQEFYPKPAILHWITLF